MEAEDTTRQMSVGQVFQDCGDGLLVMQLGEDGGQCVHVGHSKFPQLVTILQHPQLVPVHSLVMNIAVAKVAASMMFCNSDTGVMNRLVGLVDKASVSRAADPGFDSRLRRDFFSGSSHTRDLNTGTPVATVPGA